MKSDRHKAVVLNLVLTAYHLDFCYLCVSPVSDELKLLISTYDLLLKYKLFNTEHLIQ